MADSHLPNNDFVDISSSSDVEKVYHPEAARQKEKQAGKSKKKKILRITSLVLAILFLIVGGVLVYIKGIMPNYDNKGITKTNFMVDYSSASPDQPGTATNDESPTQAEQATSPAYKIVQGDDVLLRHEMVLNIMLFGRDSRDPKNSYGLSDTMILMSIDNLHKKIKLTSFQRDTYVCIPGNAEEGRGDVFDKINAAYSMGGERLAIRTIEANFGIRVDKYATVDFDAFRKIIKVLGGIDIELTLEEIRYINAQIDVNGQKERGLTDFVKYDTTKEKQTVHLDGYQALWYARDRGEENLGGNPEYSFDGDDWDRTARQRNFIETIIKYLRTKASLGELIAIVNDVGPLVTTNLKTSDIMFLAGNMMTYLSYDMEQMTVPPEDTWSYAHTSDGQSVIVIDDWDKARYEYAHFVYGDLLTTSEKK